MSQLFNPSIFNPMLGITGLLSAGAQARFYLTGTTTPATVYAEPYVDGGPNVPHGSTVDADAAARLPAIFFNPAITYRARLYTAAGVLLGDFDPLGDTELSEFKDDLGASTGSSLVGFLQSGTGAVARTVQGKLRDAVSLFDYIPEAQHAAILARTSTYNATADIQKAIDAAVTSRRRLHVPAGLYKIVPATAFADEGSLGTLTAFLMRSYMEIDAEEGATFRIADGVSSDADPQSMALFSTNVPIQDVSIFGLTMDMNGANNLISPNRPVTRTGTISLTSGSAAVTGVGTQFTTQAQAGWTILVGIYSYRVQSVTNDTSLTLTVNASATLAGQSFVAGKFSEYNQSQIYVSGTPGGVAARIDNASIERCRFINNPGVSCLCMAQSNSLGVALGSGWRVVNNDFENNGYDSIDHSSVYGWANEVLFAGNRLINPTQYTAQYGGGVAAYEVHGSNHTFVDNYVRNFYRGMWVAENYTTAAENTLVADNIFDGIKAGAVEFFGQVAAAYSARHTRVSRNIIRLDNNIHPGLDLKTGVNVASSYVQSQIEIADNWVIASGTAVGSAAVGVGGSSVAAQKHGNIVVSGNRAEATTFVVFLRTTVTNGFGPINLKNNKGQNLTAAGAFATPIGVFADGSTQGIDALIIHDNDLIDDRGSPPSSYGVYLQGVFGTIDHRPGSVVGSAITPYHENTATVTKRLGAFTLAVSYNPPSLAAAAKTSIQTTTFDGAAIGQLVTAAFSLDAAGVRFPAWVSAADTISYYAINENGADPVDLGAGSLTFYLEARS